MRVEVGTFVKTVSPHVIERPGTTGLDFALVDAEHAPFGRSDIDMMVMAGLAAGLPVFVRLPDHAPATILRTLDVGAAGIVLPHTDTVEHARAVVAAARFAGGEHGYSGSPRFAGYGSSKRPATIEQGDTAQVWCQIESRSGVDQIEQIAAVDGVDGIFVGRADLSIALGETSIGAESVMQAVRLIIAATRRAGKRVGIFVTATAEIGEFANGGVDWFVVGSDQGMLRAAAGAVAGDTPRQFAGEAA